MLGWLRQVKMVRRDTEPEPELIGELFRAAAGKFVCPECGTLGLAVTSVPEESDEDWGMPRTCETCGKPIARERLDVFPATRLCVQCQGSEDRGETPDAPEFCPRCGNLMTLGQSRSAGITRYVMTCPQCRR